MTTNFHYQLVSWPPWPNAILLIAIIFVTLAGQQVAAEKDSTPKKTCDPGTFLSTSIPGGTCADCYSHWTQCAGEATKDDRDNCEKGCGKPTPTPFIRTLLKVTPKVTNTTMIIPPMTSFTSSAEANNLTPSTAGYSSDWIYIVLGVTLAIVVVTVFILGALAVFLRWRKQKRIATLNRPPIVRYTAATQQVSSSFAGVQETFSPHSSEPNLTTTYY